MGDANEPKKMNKEQLNHFCNDLVNATEFARLKGVSPTIIYTAIQNGTINQDDIYIICGQKFWEYSKYKSLTFRPYETKKKK